MQQASDAASAVGRGELNGNGAEEECGHAPQGESEEDYEVERRRMQCTRQQSQPFLS